MQENKMPKVQVRGLTKQFGDPMRMCFALC